MNLILQRKRDQVIAIPKPYNLAADIFRISVPVKRHVIMAIFREMKKTVRPLLKLSIFSLQILSVSKLSSYAEWVNFKCIATANLSWQYSSSSADASERRHSTRFVASWGIVSPQSITFLSPWLSNYGVTLSCEILFSFYFLKDLIRVLNFLERKSIKSVTIAPCLVRCNILDSFCFFVSIRKLLLKAIEAISNVKRKKVMNTISNGWLLQPWRDLSQTNIGNVC